MSSEDCLTQMVQQNNKVMQDMLRLLLEDREDRQRAAEDRLLKENKEAKEKFLRQKGEKKQKEEKQEREKKEKEEISRREQQQKKDAEERCLHETRVQKNE